MEHPNPTTQTARMFSLRAPKIPTNRNLALVGNQYLNESEVVTLNATEPILQFQVRDAYQNQESIGIIESLAQNFISNGPCVKSAIEIDQKLPNALKFYSLIKGKNGNNKSSLEALIIDILGDSATNITNQSGYHINKARLSDSLLAYSILQTQNALRTSITETLRVFHVLDFVSGLTIENPNFNQELNTALKANVLLPRHINPINQTKLDQPDRSQIEQQKLEKLNNRKKASEELKLLILSRNEIAFALKLQTLDDLEKQEEEEENDSSGSLAEARLQLVNELQKNTSGIIDDALRSLRELQSARKKPISSNYLRNEYFEKINNDAKNYFKELKIDQTPLNINKVELELSRREIFLTEAIEANSAKNDFTLFSVNGNLISTEDICTSVVEPDPCSPPEFGELPKTIGNAVAVGVADLRVIEQTLDRYEAGEIAHIENVLAGEYRDRVHRRLDRTEEINTQSTERSSEEERDTQTTSRFTLEQSTSEVMQQDSQMNIGLNVNAHFGTPVAGVELGSSFGYATSSSQQTANETATSYAKDVTNRAVSRITEKVFQSRVTTKLQEIEEINKHGMDNKGQPNITGVYRFVDKVYKNKIKNFGLRMMLEMIVPEPAAFYINFAAQASKVPGLKKPINPASQMDVWQEWGDDNTLTDATKINRSNFLIWASRYNVQVSPPPLAEQTISTTGNYEHSGDIDPLNQNDEFHTNEKLVVPAGYKAIDAEMQINLNADAQWRNVKVWVGNTKFQKWSSLNGSTSTEGIVGKWYSPLNISENDKIPVIIHSFSKKFNYTLTVKCVLNDVSYAKWQLEAYSSIIAGYNRMVEQYEEKAFGNATSSVQIKGNNLGVNKQIAKNEMMKHAISIISGQRFNYFQAMRQTDSSNLGFPEFDFIRAKEEGKYIQFFQQAFDWENIMYVYYPYFWGRKKNWKTILQLGDTDPEFQHFLQAGAARVMVPVRKGYDDYVAWYMTTGEIWGGGEPPIVDDPHFVSLLSEIKGENFDWESETWETRVPTNLTWLQPGTDLNAY